LKWLKLALHNSLATSQWKKRWSIDSPLFLHMQHHSTTITLLFPLLLVYYPCWSLMTLFHRGILYSIFRTPCVIFRTNWQVAQDSSTILLGDKYDSYGENGPYDESNLFFFFISNFKFINKAQRGATLIHEKYTRAPLKGRNR